MFDDPALRPVLFGPPPDAQPTRPHHRSRWPVGGGLRSSGTAWAKQACYGANETGGASQLPRGRVGFSTSRADNIGSSWRGGPSGETPMRTNRIALSVAFAAGLATLPLSAAQAQYYSPYSPFALFWPFCATGAVVVAATTIITAPLRVLTGAPPFYYRCYGPSPHYPPPAYYTPEYYPPPNSSGPR